MKSRAAVLCATGEPLAIADLTLPSLAPGQVTVAVAYSGVCHTQLLEVRGKRGDDPYLPHCLGHEGSGVVVEVGSDVTRVKPGDRVILSWLKGDGANVPGCTYDWDGRTVNAGGVTTFGERMVVSENRLTPIPEALPLETAALFGCALPTGFGALLNTAEVNAGESVAVIGCGGIGICSLIAARLRECTPRIAIDRRRERLEDATRSGATNTILVADGLDLADAVSSVVPGGVDVAIEASGSVEAMATALALVRPRGGRVVVVGNAPHGSRVNVDPREFNQGKRLLGTWGGDSEPSRDFARWATWLEDHTVDLSPLWSDRYPLEAIDRALDDLESGATLRPLLEIDPIL